MGLLGHVKKALLIPVEETYAYDRILATLISNSSFNI